MTRVKICGITRPQDVDACVEAGAHFAGFNLWRGSRRYVEPHAAAKLVLRLGPTVIPVGVFVDGEPDSLVCAQVAGVAWVQIHATTSTWTNDRIVRPVVRAISVDRMLAAGDLTHADYWILDRPQSGHGGGGRRFDWSLAEGLAGHARVFVAGGLDPDNVGDVVRKLKPYAVDVASGVESAPGVKDPARIRAFMQAVEEASK